MVGAAVEDIERRLHQSEILLNFHCYTEQVYKHHCTELQGSLAILEAKVYPPELLPPKRQV